MHVPQGWNQFYDRDFTTNRHSGGLSREGDRLPLFLYGFTFFFLSGLVWQGPRLCYVISGNFLASCSPRLLWAKGTLYCMRIHL